MLKGSKAVAKAGTGGWKVISIAMLVVTERLKGNGGGQ